MGKKVYQGPIEFKADADESGQFVAEFATLNVIDHDGDVTVPGAFRDGQETLIEAWNHNYGQLPVGKGFVRERGDKAVIQGRFFLDTAHGLEHYKTVKAMGNLQEWSYTFEVLEAEPGTFDGQEVTFLRGLDVWGVAPVQRGAGIDTRTTSIKAAGDEAAKKPGEKTESPAERTTDDAGGSTEGQTGESGEPSGPPPDVVRIGIELDLLEV